MLHEKAAEAYEAKMANIPSRVVLRTAANPTNKESGDVYIKATYGPENIIPGTLREYGVDYKGKTTACYFESLDGLVGVVGEDHETLVTVAHRIANDKAYRDSLSTEFVYRLSIDWVQARVANAATTPQKFMEFIDSAALKAVKRHEVWLPIPIVTIPKPFRIGWVTFRRVTEAMMNDYAKTYSETDPDAKFAFNRLRSRIQGITAACVAVNAEPIRGKEIAYQKAEDAICILRLACPSMVNPHEWAPLDPSFFDRPTQMALQVQNMKIVGQTRSAYPQMLHQWLVNSDEVDSNLKGIWACGHNLIISKRNEFQNILLGAAIHLSKSILKPDLAERLLYVVTALEAIFVKDSTENIVQNLRERMAILSGPGKDERLRKRDMIPKIYQLRSDFVHRGIGLNDISLLEDFFFEALTTLQFLLHNYKKWRTKADFLKCLDDYKFAAPEFDTEGMPDV